jgi:hypothetical protein
LEITRVNNVIVPADGTVDIIANSESNLPQSLNNICSAINAKLSAQAEAIIKTTYITWGYSSGDPNDKKIYIHIESAYTGTGQNTIKNFKFTIKSDPPFNEDEFEYTNSDYWVDEYTNLKRLFNIHAPTPLSADETNEYVIDEKVFEVHQFISDIVITGCTKVGRIRISDNYYILSSWDRIILNMHASFSNGSAYNYIGSSLEPQYLYGKVFVINESGGTFDIWFSNDGIHKIPLNDISAQFELTYVLNAKRYTEYNVY